MYSNGDEQVLCLLLYLLTVVMAASSLISLSRQT